MKSSKKTIEEKALAENIENKSEDIKNDNKDNKDNNENNNTNKSNEESIKEKENITENNQDKTINENDIKNIEEKIPSSHNPEQEKAEKIINLYLSTFKNFKYFEIILIQFCKFFTSQIQDSDLSYDGNNSKFDRDLFIIKFCNESNFINLQNFYEKCYPEILKYLSNSKNFSLMSTEKIRKNIERNLIDLDTNERVEILFYLANSALDFNDIRQNIKEDVNKKNELEKEKHILEFEFRTKENRKKEIEKMEKFQNGNSRIKLLDERLETLRNNPEDPNSQKHRKEIEIERERYISVNNFYLFLFF